ncbi:MAG: hypothetical protein RMJ07_05495 [Nitrososphaerota archaeon]|nr:hypothetical protein [Nitrososphaerota archaeon]
MTKEELNVIDIFNQAWAELYCPPVKLSLQEKAGRKRRPSISVLNGEVNISSLIVPAGCNPNEFLLWIFRHELSHVHHCPYDIKTAYSLEKAAYEITRDWALAFLATKIFCDCQIDINYLPRRFGEFPYYMRIVGDRPRSFAEQVMKEIYLHVFPVHKSKSKELAGVAREILTVTLLDKTWHTKVQIIAHILTSLVARHPEIISKKELMRDIEYNPLIVREDFSHSSLDMFSETYGSISDESAAKEFYNQWIKPRMPRNEMEKIKSLINEKMRMQGGNEKEIMKEIKALRQTLEVTKASRAERSSLERFTTGEAAGREPVLPTSLSTPITRIRSGQLDDLLWKRYWYKARAEHAILRYLSESRRHQPTWSVMKYPDEWYIEDEIEALDVETSLDEGPLIPEVTTIKWVEEPTPHGQSIISGFVPSAITILDVSRSMLNVHNEAAVAAYIAYLSARRAGGQTSTIAFSTKYFSAGWDSAEDVKEIALAMEFNEYTVFPIHEVLRLLKGERSPCFIMIITDGGWQNLAEVAPALERIADSGHRIVLFLLKGGNYPERIEVLKQTPNIMIHNVLDPERDLQGLVISESAKTFRAYLM